MDPVKRKEAARKAFDLAQTQGYFIPLAPRAFHNLTEA